MNKKISGAALFIGVLLTGASQAEVTALPASTTATTLSAEATRAAILSGNAFAIAQGGEAVSCAGREVVATPDGPTAVSSVHRTICDWHGKFVFQDLSAQGWTVRTTIMWNVPGKQSIRHLGGELVRHIVLQPGDNAIALGGQPGASPVVEELAASQASR